MAITHTETVSNLTVLNDGSDVVSEVMIKTLSVDDSDPTNLTIESEQSYSIDTSGGSSASGFVAFGSLSETVVKGWITDELSKSNTKINQEAWIESVKNPPAPPQVDKTLPW
tara:strand:- start:774 stop:1109 length:336 start_codon:yes stop_codon:yes gene_type:complete